MPGHRERPVGPRRPDPRPSDAPRWMTRISVPANASSLRDVPSPSTDRVARALDAIDRLDPTLHAWVTVDREAALRAARTSDRLILTGRARSELEGVPIGVKDVIDTKGLRTTYGSSVFESHVPARDARVVARLRRSGAVIVGKTTTTPFAMFDPTITGNPWNLERTPGGSSSGSAAAVAAGIVPLAVGTQTSGSTIRPAAFCGIVGFVPAPGRISRVGIFPCSPSLDRVGLFACTVAEVAQLYQACATYSGRASPSLGRADNGVHRVAILEPLVARAAPEMTDAVASAVAVLERLGVAVETASLAGFERALAANTTIMQFELARTHRGLFESRASAYPPGLRDFILEGSAVPVPAYRAAVRERRRFRRSVEDLLEWFDALLSPAAPGEAGGRSSTGDPVMNVIAGLSGAPAVTIPATLSRAGLPLGIQLVAGADAEADLLHLAGRVEREIAFQSVPPLHVSRRNLPPARS